MVPAAIVDDELDELVAAARAGRHRHRRRQLVLPRRHPPRQGAQGRGHPLRRRRHQRRRVGPRARLLPDDRRRAGRRRAPRADLRGARAGRRAPPTRTPGREGEPAPPSRATCTAARTAPGHFVKMVHNGIEYGIMAAYAEGLNILQHANVGKRPARRRRRDDAAARARALPVRLRPADDRRGMAARQRDRLLAARPDRRGAARGPDARPSSRPRVGLRRGPLDDLAAIDEGVPAPVLTTALFARFSSRGEADFADKRALGDAPRVRRPRREAARRMGASRYRRSTASGPGGHRPPPTSWRTATGDARSRRAERCQVALAGGSTPKRTYERLGRWRRAGLGPGRAVVGDERDVPD